MAENTNPYLQSAVLAGGDPNAYRQMLVQQANLQRNQALAQALSQQAMQGDNPNQEVSGRVVQYSPVQGMTQLAKAWLANNVNNNVANQSADIQLQQGQMYRQAMAAALQKMQGGQQPAPSVGTGQISNSSAPAQTPGNAPVPLNSDLGSGTWGIGATPGVAPTQQQPSPQQAPQQSGGSPISSFANNALGIAADPSMNLLFPKLAEQYGAAGVNAQAPTDVMKNNSYMGISPDVARQMALAKALSDGQTEIKPGAYVNFMSGQSGFVPQVPANSQPNQPYNPLANGGRMGQVSAVNGAIPVQAATTGATTNATTANTLHNVTGPDGSTGTVLGRNIMLGGVGWPGAVAQPGVAQPSAAPRPAGVWGPAPAAADQMKNDYTGLVSARASAPAMQQELGRMIQIGQNPTAATGPYGTAVAKLFSNDAAEYEKGRDFVVSQLSSGGMSTDAARSMVYGAIPGYDAPQQAKLAGLNNLNNQIGVRALKADYLNQPFTTGNSAAYSTQSNQFDRNITPAMYPALTMPSGPARANVLRELSKDPHMRSGLEWAVQNGLLK